jgi:hypothetical protein
MAWGKPVEWTTVGGQKQGGAAGSVANQNWRVPVNRRRWGKPQQSIEEQINYRTAEREKEIRGLLDQIIGLYKPGGGFGAGTQAEIERTKKKDVASATQQMISSGMYGTTTAAGLPSKWEETVGMPSRLKLEDMRYAQLAQALGGKASFVERIEEMMPDYGLLAQLTSV